MGINKIRISAVFMVFCCMLSPLSAFADNLDYSDTDGVISGSQAPTAAELREQMEEAWEKGNVQKMQEIAAADYSTYVAKTDNISVDVHESNQWRLNKEVFGVEYEFVDEYDRYYENGELKRSYLDMQQSGRAGKIPVIRFGGGASATINMIHTMQFAERFEMFLESTAHYIFLSTYRVYADKETPIRETSPRLLDATTDMQYLSTEEYGLFKARCENILRASKYNNWTIVRPAITYSKYRFQLTTLEAYVFVRRCRQGLPSIVPEDALNVQATMSWGGDVGKMISLLVCNERAKREIFTASTAEHHTWGEIAEYYKELIGLEYIPVNTETYLKLSPYMTYQLKYDRYFNRIIDNSKILSVTGLKQSELMPLKQGLKKELGALPKDYLWFENDISNKMDEILKNVM